MINETQQDLKLTGGAVSFQSQYATQQLGALRYVSTGLVCSHTSLAAPGQEWHEAQTLGTAVI